MIGIVLAAAMIAGLSIPAAASERADNNAAVSRTGIGNIATIVNCNSYSAGINPEFTGDSAFTVYNGNTVYIIDSMYNSRGNTVYLVKYYNDYSEKQGYITSACLRLYFDVV